MDTIHELRAEIFGTYHRIKIKFFNDPHQLACYCNDDVGAPDALFVKRYGSNTSSIFFQLENFDVPRVYTHELLHATKYILLSCLNIDDEEAECYLLGYLTEQYINFLINYKETNNVSLKIRKDDASESALIHCPQ